MGSLDDMISKENADALLRMERTPKRIVEPEPPPLASDDPPVEVKTPEQKDISILDDILSIPKQVAAGAGEALVQQGRAVRDVTEWAADHLDPDSVDVATEYLDSLPDVPIIDESGGPISGFARVLTQFAVGMAGPAKILKLGKMAYKGASIVRGAISGGAAGATAFDPDDANVAEVVRDLAAKSETAERLFKALPRQVQDILVKLPDQPHDSPMMKRMKAFFAEAAIGIPFDAILSAARTFKAMRSAKQLEVENMRFDEQSDELRQMLGDTAPVASKADDASREIEQLNSALEGHQAELTRLENDHGSLSQLKKDAKRAEKELDKLLDDPDLPPEAAVGDSEMLDSILHAVDQQQGIVDVMQEITKDIKRATKKAQAAAKKAAASTVDSKTGLFKGADRFVYKIVKGGKPFNLGDLGVNLNVRNTAALVKEIGKVVKRLNYEIAHGSAFGSKAAKQKTRDVLENVAHSLSDDADKFLSESIAAGTRTKEEAIAVEIMRTISGNQVFGTMKRAMAGDPQAIADLPVALARAADIELLAQESDKFFSKVLTSRETQRNLDISQFGFGRDYNKQAAELLKKMSESVPNADGIDIAVRLNALKNPEQYRQLVNDAGRPGMFHAFLEYYYNTILSGVDSMINSGIGSHAFLAYQIPVRGMAAVIGSAQKAIIGPPKFGQAQDSASFSALLAGLQGYGQAFANSIFPMIRNFARIGVLKEPELAFSQQKFEAFHQKALTGEVMAPAINALDKVVRFASQDAISIKDPATFLVNTVGKVMRSFQNVYGTFDEFNKQVASNFEKHYQAQLLVDQAGLPTKEAGEMMQELLKNTPKNVTDMAERFADMIAFTEKLDKSEGFRQWVDNYPALRLMFPFVRSQASMLSAFLSNTPVAPLVSPKFKEAWKKGGSARQIAVSQSVLGGMVGWQIYQGWLSGRITGSRKNDPAHRAELKELGWEPSSVLIDGDAWPIQFMSNLSPMKTMAGKVVHVDDADTVTIEDAEGEKHEIRFKGVNADEKNQNLGSVGTKKLKEMIAGKHVTVEWQTKGHFGRTIGTVFFDGKNINQAIIEESPGVHAKPAPARYVSFAPLEPFATYFNGLVDTFEAIQSVDDPERTKNMIQIISEDVGANLLNRQYFNGVFQLIDGMNTGGDDFITNLSDSLVPRFAKQVANTLAGKKRNMKTYDPNLSPEAKFREKTLSEWKSLDPRYRSDLPVYDGHGHTGVRPPATVGSFFNIPKTHMQAARNDSTVYMHFLQNQFHRPSFEPKIAMEGVSVDLTPHEHVEYGRLMGEIQIAGKEYMIAMRDLVISEVFLSRTIGPKGGRYMALDLLHKSYKKAAALALLKSNKSLKDRFLAEVAKLAEPLTTDSLPTGLPRDIDVLLKNTIGDSSQ